MIPNQCLITNICINLTLISKNAYNAKKIRKKVNKGEGNYSLVPHSGHPGVNETSRAVTEALVLNPSVIEASEVNTPTTTGGVGGAGGAGNMQDMALVPRPPNSQPYVS